MYNFCTVEIFYQWDGFIFMSMYSIHTFFLHDNFLSVYHALQRVRFWAPAFLSSWEMIFPCYVISRSILLLGFLSSFSFWYRFFGCCARHFSGRSYLMLHVTYVRSRTPDQSALEKCPNNWLPEAFFQSFGLEWAANWSLSKFLLSVTIIWNYVHFVHAEG